MAKQIAFFYRYLSLLMLLFMSTQQVFASSNNLAVNDQRTVQVAVTDIPQYLSPYAHNPLPDQYSHLFFDPLVRWGKDKKIEYRLLEKLKMVHSTKIRFYLKNKIYFHSGNLMTSKDVIWSVNQALKKKYLEQKLQHSIKTTAINQFQFDIESQLTQAQLLDYLTHVFILDSAFYKKNKIDHNSTQKNLLSPIKQLPLSGTGPYKLSAFYADVNLTVQENTHYWQQSPAVKRLNFLRIKSPDSRLYALLANDIDISEDIADKKINSLDLSGNKDIYQTSTINTLFLTINEQQNTIFSREIARNAIHLAINQAGILKHILNDTGAIERIFRVNNPSSQLPNYDVKRAKTILKKINAPKEVSLLLMAEQSSSMQEVVFALTNMLKKVGITLKVTEADTVQKWRELQFSHDLTLAMWESSLIEESLIYQDIFTNSLLADYLTLQFTSEDKPLTIEDKIAQFEMLQEKDKIIPLFSKNKIWATDSQFDLTELFSINGIPYWHQLSIID